MVKKKKRFDAVREVRKLARERLGTTPAGRVIQPKTRRKNPKHPKREREAWEE